MIKEDRQLLARLRTVNQQMGEVLLAVLDRLEDGIIPPGDLRDLATALKALAGDLDAAADRRDSLPHADEQRAIDAAEPRSHQ